MMYKIPVTTPAVSVQSHGVSGLGPAITSFDKLCYLKTCINERVLNYVESFHPQLLNINSTVDVFYDLPAEGVRICYVTVYPSGSRIDIPPEIISAEDVNEMQQKVSRRDTELRRTEQERISTLESYKAQLISIGVDPRQVNALAFR